MEDSPTSAAAEKKQAGPAHPSPEEQPPTTDDSRSSAVCIFAARDGREGAEWIISFFMKPLCHLVLYVQLVLCVLPSECCGPEKTARTTREGGALLAHDSSSSEILLHGDWITSTFCDCMFFLIG